MLGLHKNSQNKNNRVCLKLKTGRLGVKRPSHNNHIVVYEHQTSLKAPNQLSGSKCPTCTQRVHFFISYIATGECRLGMNLWNRSSDDPNLRRVETNFRVFDLDLLKTETKKNNIPINDALHMLNHIVWTVNIKKHLKTNNTFNKTHRFFSNHLPQIKEPQDLPGILRQFGRGRLLRAGEAGFHRLAFQQRHANGGFQGANLRKSTKEAMIFPIFFLNASHMYPEQMWKNALVTSVFPIFVSSSSTFWQAFGAKPSGKSLDPLDSELDEPIGIQNMNISSNTIGPKTWPTTLFYYALKSFRPWAIRDKHPLVHSYRTASNTYPLARQWFAHSQGRLNNFAAHYVYACQNVIESTAKVLEWTTPLIPLSKRASRIKSEICIFKL